MYYPEVIIDYPTTPDVTFYSKKKKNVTTPDVNLKFILLPHQFWIYVTTPEV